MSPIPFYFSSGISAVCLILSAWLCILGSESRELQSQLQQLQIAGQSQQQVLQEGQQKLEAQQQQINAGTTISQQVGPALLRDMAVASTKNEEMKAILTKHGYNVELSPGSPADAGATQP